jgi:hypothetical protein
MNSGICGTWLGMVLQLMYAAAAPYGPKIACPRACRPM